MLRPNPHIEALDPAGHGGINYGELAKSGLSPEEVLDFSVCTNPCGPPAGVVEALKGACIDRYPDSESSRLRYILAEKLKVFPNQILVGSGSTELFRMIVKAYLGAGEKVIMPRPTYSEYSLASRIEGAEVVEFPLEGEKYFRLDVSEFGDFIRWKSPRAVFLCNPNNPTGQYLSMVEIESILKTISEGLLILDEAYLNFTGNIEDCLPLLKYPNLIIVRSMTKDYAIPGLRLGYLIADHRIVEVLRKVKPPWNVSAPAQSAGKAALEAENYLPVCRKQIQKAKEYLVQGLRKLGLSPIPSSTHFFLVKVGNAAAIKEALFHKGILVRDCTSFGLPAYIRLSTRTRPECAKLIAALNDPEVPINHGG
jgi:histidinol-phosphate aminotransferase